MKSLNKTKFFQLLITNYQLLAILLLAAVVRFGGLNWCFPYSPHPDEWNMARAVTQLNWQEGLNPHFFAYGQFPLYLSYFSAIIYNKIPWINIGIINIQEAVFFLRFWSALAGVGTVYLVYLISKKLIDSYKLQATSYLPTTAALLAAFTPGLIQISHFGTTESLLSFFFLLILLFSFKILEKPKFKYYVLTGIILGLAVGTKISALAFGFPVFLVFAIQSAQILKKKEKIKKIFFLFLKNFSLLTVLFLLTLLSSPYLILAFKDSRGTLVYETSVAAGQTMVFYTRQFIQTTPVIFQIQKIFPYAFGWPIFIIGITGIIISAVQLIKNLRVPKFVIRNSQFAIFLFSFLSYFFFQAFLFTKWTRFMSPIFAFFPIFAVLTLDKIFQILKFRKKFAYLLICLFAYLSILPGILFTSIYFSPDIRFTASNWIFKNIPSNSKILFDTGNVVDIPIYSPNHQPPATNYFSVSFDFYNLDENYELFPKLLRYLEMSDYIFVPSRRVFFNHQRLPEKFPLTAKYYELLFSDKLGFSEVRKFEPFYSKIFKDEKAEETFSVFDHPTIRIYKKTAKLTVNDYENLFK